MRVLIAGASGLVGSALVPLLQSRGHEVRVLVRRTARTPSEIAWDPVKGIFDAAKLAPVDALINLAGAGVGDRRWTSRRRRIITESRLQTTSLLAGACAVLRPSVLVNASAVGYYGDRDDEVLTEASPAGRGFLAQVCRDWEHAALAAETAGVRVVRLRFGMVLSGAGGALPRLASLARSGLGCRFGSGLGWQPWISRLDAIHLISLCLEDTRLRGAVNAVAPKPVTQGEFAEILSASLGRGSPWRLPTWLPRLVLGDMADELLLPSQRVFSASLQAVGYTYRHPLLPEAIAEALAIG